MAQYIMALDAGTTSNRCILFDKQGRVCSVAQKEFTQYFPKPGWVEHDANEIWTTQLGVALSAMNADRRLGGRHRGHRHHQPAGDHHRLGPRHRRAGLPRHRLAVPPHQRTLRPAQGPGPHRAVPAEDRARHRRLFLRHQAAVDPRQRGGRPGPKAEAGQLLFGTVETWLIWKLTCGKIHVTDYANASRTMLFNIHTLDWDDEILEILDIPRCMLPRPVPNSALLRVRRPHALRRRDQDRRGGGRPAGGPLRPGLLCTPADAKNTYGTGGFPADEHRRTEPVLSRNGLVTTVAWGLGGRVTYALEGSIFVAGAAIQWLRDELKILEEARDSEYMALKVPDTNGCYVVPAFTGLGAPHWDQYARGAIVGLTRGCNKNHIIRATLDSLCYQVNDVLKAMEADAGIRLAMLKVDGGASANNYLLQAQADISGAPVERPSCVETTALGAAYLAGLAVGYWDSPAGVLQNRAVDRVFTPQISEADRARRIRGWNKAVRCAFDWAREEEEEK